MNSRTLELKYKQSIFKYALRNGVTEASIVYKKHRKQYIDGLENMMKQ